MTSRFAVGNARARRASIVNKPAGCAHGRGDCAVNRMMPRGYGPKGRTPPGNGFFARLIQQCQSAGAPHVTVQRQIVAAVEASMPSLMRSNRP
jgi:hypothetical protein